MFYAEKYSKLSVTVATKDYDVDGLNAAVQDGRLRLKEGWYLRLGKVPFFGCGDKPPADWEYRGNIDPSTTPEGLASDILEFCESQANPNDAANRLAAQLNNGAYLDDKAGFNEWKKPSAKMSVEKKVSWMLSHQKATAMAILAAVKDDEGPKALAAKYDELNPKANEAND